MRRVAIGVDIGGGSVRMGLVSTNGRILVRSDFKTTDYLGRRKLLAALIRTLDGLLRVAKKKNLKVTGIGIGAPGPIDVEKGFVYFFPNIPGWKNTPLKKILEKKIKLPVFVDNDANVMALAEFRFGAGRGARTLIALTLGTGIGGGLVIDGKLYHGHSYSAAEIGHMVINENGPRCSCGNRGCVETYVGTNYFVRSSKNRKRLSPQSAARAALRGDADAKELWKETARHLGTALVGLVNILNPERIVLGGGIAQSGGLLFRPLKAAIRRKAFPIAAASVKVVAAKLGMDAGIIGAATLVF